MTRQRWMLFVSAGLVSLLSACGMAAPAPMGDPLGAAGGVNAPYAPEATEAAASESDYFAVQESQAYPIAAPTGAAQNAGGGAPQPEMMYFQDYGTNPFV